MKPAIHFRLSSVSANAGKLIASSASGGAGAWPAKIARLARYQQATGGQPIILVGGGVDAAVIKAIRATTSLTEFHIGRAARVPAAVTGAVQSARVKELQWSVGAADSQSALGSSGVETGTRTRAQIL